MAEGRAARWTAAMLAAPVVAGVFAATTSWATKADPLHPQGSGKAAGQPKPQPLATTDPAVIALKTELAREQAAVDRLSAQVGAVRAKAAALAKANRAGSSGSSGASGGAIRSGGSSVASGSRGAARSSGSTGSTSHAAPAPAPAAAPPTQGSTGASGTK